MVIVLICFVCNVFFKYLYFKFYIFIITRLLYPEFQKIILIIAYAVVLTVKDMHKFFRNPAMRAGLLADIIFANIIKVDKLSKSLYVKSCNFGQYEKDFLSLIMTLPCANLPLRMSIYEVVYSMKDIAVIMSLIMLDIVSFRN